MAKPLLHLGDIGLVRERVGRRRGAQRMHTQAVNLGVDAGFPAIFLHDIPIDRCRIEMPAKATGAIVFHGPHDE
jgi:hypothetical protein